MDDTKKQKKNNIFDFIVKLIILIIIILLFLHSYKLYRKAMENTNSYNNIDIFEITCDNSKCANNKSNPITNQSEKISYVYVETTKTSNDTEKPKEEEKPKPDEPTEPDDPTPDDPTPPEPDDPTEPDDDDEGEMSVYDSNITWHGKRRVNIFSNNKYDEENEIAPGDSGSYQFIVKNGTKYTLSYNISFSEDNDDHMNLKYKLKKDNSYIAGSSDEWVSYSDLAKTGITLDSSQHHQYTLEWKWVDSDYDTAAGFYQAQYSLSIEIRAVQVDD